MSDDTVVGLDPRVGTTFTGYKLEALLGRGDRSVVYRATDTKTLRRVALKVFDPLPSGDPQFRARLFEETELVRTLKHPSIVRIYEAGEEQGHLYVATAYIDGFDLRTAISLAGKLEPQQAIAILGAVADALDAARWARGLVHGNVKPSNILIPTPGSDTRASRAYLTDFGTRTAVPYKERVDAGEASTGLGCVAPEQIDGRPISPRTDVYALGCVFYECLTGGPPYDGTGAAVLKAHLHAEPAATKLGRHTSSVRLDGVVANALAKWPEERYSTCLELALSAHRALTPRSTAPDPAVAETPHPKRCTARFTPPPLTTPEIRRAKEEQPPAPSATRRRVTRKGLLTTLLIGAALVALVVAAISLTKSSPDEPVEAGGASSSTEDAVEPDQAPDNPGADGSQTAVQPPTPDHILVQIDVESGEIVQTIEPASRGRLDTYAFGTSAAWLATPTEGTVSRLDLESHDVTRTVDIPGHPIDVALGHRSVWVVSANRGNPSDTSVPEGPGILTRMSPRTGRVLSTTDLEYSWPVAIATGSRAIWVAGTGSKGHGLVRVEPQINEVVTTIPLEVRPISAVAINGAVWVAGRSLGVILSEPPRNTLTRVDSKTNEITATIELPDPPGELLTSLAVGARSTPVSTDAAVWVVSESIGSLVRVDRSTHQVTRRIQVDDASVRAGPWGLGVAVGGSSVWVASFLHKNVKQLSPQSGEVVSTIPVPGRPVDIQGVGDAIWVTVIPTDPDGTDADSPP